MGTRWCRSPRCRPGYRLMMHGLDVEGLHGWLRVIKRRQAAGLPIDPRVPTADRPVAPM